MASLRSTKTILRSISSSTIRNVSTTSSTSSKSHSRPQSTSTSTSTSTKIPKSQPTITPQLTPKEPRIYPERKSFLHQYYTHLLKTSPMVLLFKHSNLTVSDLSRIRRNLSKLPPPPPSLQFNENVKGEGEAKATLMISRTGVLSSVTRSLYPKLSIIAEEESKSKSSGSNTKSSKDTNSNSKSKSKSKSKSNRINLKGQTALLTSPTLSPHYLSKILTSINRSIKTSKREITPTNPDVKQPELNLILGVMEGREILNVNGIEEISKLPELDVLRAQLVGLLEMSGRSLIGVLEQGKGGSLVRTLQGLENDLKVKENGEAKAET